MDATLAEALVTAAGFYFALGAVFAVAFAIRGAGRIDPAARSGSLGFRLAILPGAAALWPLLARRWRAGVAGPPEEDDAHVEASRSRGGA